MPEVKMYADVEGDAKVGDIVDLPAERATRLVMEGKATWVAPAADGSHLPPVGGLRVDGVTLGVEPSAATAAAVLTPESQRETPLTYQDAGEEEKGWVGHPDAAPGPRPEEVLLVPRNDEGEGEEAGGAAPESMGAGDDPADFTVEQVNDYLATLDPESPEYIRVMEAEQNGKARVGIVG